jgi:hypothetical protein
MSPIDYLCSDCGASFEIGVGSLLTDDYQPGCPVCESARVGTDWDAVSRRFGDVADPAPRRSGVATAGVLDD